jgi:universal stress protein A
MKTDALTPVEQTAPANETIALKRILVPVDFSESSRKALQYALAFATQFNAEVTLLHVVPNVVAESRIAFDMPELQRSLLTEARQKLDEELKAFSGRPVKCAVTVVRGVPYHEIVEVAKKSNIDLIVLGTHGRTGLKHLVMGSTAERVVRHANCPVLVVREREHEFITANA